MRIHRILKMMVTLAIVTLPFTISSNASANAGFRGGPAGTPVIYEVFTGKALPANDPSGVGYRIKLELNRYPGQQNFAGNFTEEKHSISTVTGSEGEAEYNPGEYYIQFTINQVLSGVACLHCRYTGKFVDGSTMKQAHGFWQSETGIPTGQTLGQFYLNRT